MKPDIWRETRDRILEVLRNSGADFLGESSQQVADDLADIAAPSLVVLEDVLDCWQARPDMNGQDHGHFNQTLLRELRPKMLEIARSRENCA
jgi:hypothetical protein